MFRFIHRGDFNNTEKFLKALESGKIFDKFDQYGQMGVEALAAATPKRTGKTAASWSYEIEKGGGKTTIHWRNTNENGGENIAMLIQYGHGTGRGVYVTGRDYINPAMRNVFQQIADQVWEEVINA